MSTNASRLIVLILPSGSQIDPKRRHSSPFSRSGLWSIGWRGVGGEEAKEAQDEEGWQAMGVARGPESIREERRRETQKARREQALLRHHALLMVQLPSDWRKKINNLACGRRHLDVGVVCREMI